MLDFLLCTVLISLINSVFIVLGYTLGLVKGKPERIKEIFFRESELEEAYSPEED